MRQVHFRKWFKTVSWLALAIGAMMLVLSLRGVIGHRAIAEADSEWQLAADAAPPGLMDQVRIETLQPGTSVDVGQMKIWKVQLPGQRQPLYLINSQVANLAEPANANPLCGASGCAFFGYIPAEATGYQQVWNAYLNVHLPPRVALFEPPEALQNGMPVLRINQMDGDRIQQLYLTFNGQTYEITKTLWTPQTYD